MYTSCKVPCPVRCISLAISRSAWFWSLRDFNDSVSSILNPLVRTIVVDLWGSIRSAEILSVTAHMKAENMCWVIIDSNGASVFTTKGSGFWVCC